MYLPDYSYASKDTEITQKTTAEKHHIEEFDTEWNRSVELMNECYRLTDELKRKYLAFWESVHAADDVIDFEIQEYLKIRLEKITK